MSSLLYNCSYYAGNRQDRDRPALWFYTRLAKRVFSPGRVLDFGAGTGFFMKRLGQFFAVEGFEISPHGVESARQLLPYATVFSNLNEIPSGVYSGVTALHVLEHVSNEELPKVLATLRRALAPGGRVLCVMPELDGLGHRLKGEEWSGFKDRTHVSLKNRVEWFNILEKNQFSVINAGADGLWDFSYTPGWPRVADMVRRALPTLFQFLAGRMILNAGSGESLILILEPAASVEEKL